jgi:hypothetical protein
MAALGFADAAIVTGADFFALAACLEAATALWVWRSPLWSLRAIGGASNER